MVTTQHVPTVHRHPLTAGPTAATLWVGSELLWVAAQFATCGFLLWIAHVLTLHPTDDRAMVGPFFAELLLVVGLLARRRLMRAAQLHTPGALVGGEPTALPDVLRTRGPGWAVTLTGTVALAPTTLWLMGTTAAGDRGPLLDATAGEVFLGLVLGMCWVSVAVSLVRGVWDAVAGRRALAAAPQIVSLMGHLLVLGLLWPHATGQVRSAVVEVGGAVAVMMAVALVTVRAVRAFLSVRSSTSAGEAEYPLGECLLTWWGGSSTVTERARYAGWVEYGALAVIGVVVLGAVVAVIAVS